jgi:hypothetical protein
MLNNFELRQERHHPVAVREVCTNRYHTSDDAAPTGLVICWGEGFYKDAAPTALGVGVVRGCAEFSYERTETQTHLRRQH